MTIEDIPFLPNRAKKHNLNEIRVFAPRRSGHHGIIAWLMGHFKGEVYRLNNVTDWRLHAVNGGGWDEDLVNPGSGDVRDCYIWNAEDADLQIAAEKIKSDEWRTLNGQSDLVQNILVLRDPYNMVASRIRRFGWAEYEGKDPLGLWKRYAREFVGETSHLPAGTVKISFNAWFAAKEYRRMVSERLGFPFTDQRIGDILVRSSFDPTNRDGRTMKVLDRWKSYVKDPRFVAIFSGDEEARVLAEAIHGEFAKSILKEMLAE